MIMKQRYNRPFADLANDFENIIEHVFGDSANSTSTTSTLAPRANVYEVDSGYSVELELPGVDPETVNVELNEGTLEISGDKNVELEVEGRKTLESERRSGSFKRTFKFSIQLDAEKITAGFKNGILTVDLPKSEKVLPRKIEVKVSE